MSGTDDEAASDEDLDWWYESLPDDDERRIAREARRYRYVPPTFWEKVREHAVNIAIWAVIIAVVVTVMILLGSLFNSHPACPDEFSANNDLNGCAEAPY